jgi:hypothetical protein
MTRAEIDARRAAIAAAKRALDIDAQQIPTLIEMLRRIGELQPLVAGESGNLVCLTLTCQ